MLEAPREMFEAKGQAGLLNDLPQHRLAACCKAFLEPIASGHEIINASTRPERVADSEGMRDDAGPFPPIHRGEPALIGINPAPQSKVVEIAENPVAGRGSDELRRALGETVFDEQPVERLEKRAGERMRLAPTLPLGAMQCLQRIEKFERLRSCRRRGQPQRRSARTCETPGEAAGAHWC